MSGKHQMKDISLLKYLARTPQPLLLTKLNQWRLRKK